MNAGARIRVMVADDDQTIRDTIAALIGNERAFELVGTATDARAAIELAALEKPDVALVDVRMPGTGVSAARGIKRSSPATRVLALSAHDDRATVLDMLEAGAAGYLVKGSPIEEIIESIERAGRGEGSLSTQVAGPVIEELAGELTRRRRKVNQRQMHERRIGRAINQDDVLHMVFQPIYALGPREIVGAEALARFEAEPKRGPDRWFAEATEVGLRQELELAAIRKALARLPELPSGTYLTLNASPETLATAAFRKLLSAADPTRVVVEITEHAPIEDYERLNKAIDRLREHGPRLAIDDAGAGFASLRHILRLAPDFVKLDRTLIDGIDQDRSRQALAAGLISFAEKIDATIIAEGIEDLPELEALMALGVSYGQGYYLARPGPLPLPLPPGP